jgi:diguanylate cyclase (GGDEF)-like protein
MMYFLHRRSRLGAVTRSRLMATDQDDSLTGLLKARETLYRLDGMLKRTRNGQKNMGAVLLGLVNFETIRRAHGREVADTALIVMAQHIKSICSDLDISGRVDSNQFLICLEGHLVEDKLKSVGSALIAKGLRQSKFLPLGVTLDFALVLSMLDGYEPNANDVLKQMADKYDEINPNDTKRVLHCRVRGLAPDDADVWPA